MKKSPNSAGGLQSLLAHDVETMAAGPMAVYSVMCREGCRLCILQGFSNWSLHVTAAMSHWSN